MLESRPRGGFAELANQQPPRPKGLLAGDNLLDARRRQGLEDRLAPTYPIVAVALTRSNQRRMLEPWPETTWIVGCAEQPRQLIKTPLSSCSPGSRSYVGAMRDDLDQAWARRGTRCTQVHGKHP